MPIEPVTADEDDVLDCGCHKDQALIEEIYVSLGIVGKEVAEARKEEGKDSSGWKAMGRPERERVLKILEMLGHSLDDLLELVQKEE
jgi:hypothetical protein